MSLAINSCSAQIQSEGPNPNCFTRLPIGIAGDSSCVANVFDQDLHVVNAETKIPKNTLENLMQRKTRRWCLMIGNYKTPYANILVRYNLFPGLSSIE